MRYNIFLFVQTKYSIPQLKHGMELVSFLRTRNFPLKKMIKAEAEVKSSIKQAERETCENLRGKTDGLTQT